MSDKYEIQWPLRVQMGTGVHGARAEVRDAGDISVAEFPSNHPDPKAAAEAEMKRLTDEYGPAWSVSSAGLYHRGEYYGVEGASDRIDKLAAHLNATGYRP